MPGFFYPSNMCQNNRSFNPNIYYSQPIGVFVFQQITLPRTFQNVLATSNETGIYIVAGWTMAIPKKDAIAYVKSYNTHPNVGFYQHNGQVILTHRDGRLDLSPQEANAIIDLIKAAYGPF